MSTIRIICVVLHSTATPFHVTLRSYLSQEGLCTQQRYSSLEHSYFKHHRGYLKLFFAMLGMLCRSSFLPQAIFSVRSEFIMKHIIARLFIDEFAYIWCKQIQSQSTERAIVHRDFQNLKIPVTILVFENNVKKFDQRIKNNMTI